MQSSRKGKKVGFRYLNLLNEFNTEKELNSNDPKYDSENLVDLNILIDDKSKTSQEILNSIRINVKDNSVKIVFVDPLNYIKNFSLDKSSRPKILMELKFLAQELNIPIITSLNLNKESVRNNSQRIPNINSIKNFGKIEPYVDMVAFLYRPEFYGIYENEEGEDLRNSADIIIAKNKSGRIGTVKFSIITNRLRFTKYNPRKKNRFIILDENGEIKF